MWQPFLRHLYCILSKCSRTSFVLQLACLYGPAVLSVIQWTLLKHWPQPVTWAYASFVHHQTAEERALYVFANCLTNNCHMFIFLLQNSRTYLLSSSFVVSQSSTVANIYHASQLFAVCDNYLVCCGLVCSWQTTIPFMSLYSRLIMADSMLRVLKYLLCSGMKMYSGQR